MTRFNPRPALIPGESVDHTAGHEGGWQFQSTPGINTGRIRRPAVGRQA